jgi:hypothetical protein
MASNGNKDFTRAYGRALGAMYDMGEIGMRDGILDPSQLRLTIEARKQQAAKMIENGMSHRATAKALSVSPKQIRRDLGADKSRTSGAKSPTSGAKVPTNDYDEAADIRPFPPQITRENKRGYLLMNCATATQIAQQMIERYDGPLDEEIRTVARQTADAWNQLANKLGGQR